ncbi:MAG: DUF3662 domain-containing protein [Corynebacteriales bacterium]|nr:DUF3662 domain-containing protein [Mycobacteriales bacterium]
MDNQRQEEPVGVLQRFEKRLENLVEGAFARVFKGVVHPVEIANAMQREADAHKSILGGGRILVPNRYIIDLSPGDHEQLAQYAAPLAQELAQAQAEFIGEQGWMVYGDVIVEIERGEGLETGMFRVAAEVFTGGMESQPPPPPADGGWQQQNPYGGQDFGGPPPHQQSAPPDYGQGAPQYGQDPYGQPAPSSGAPQMPPSPIPGMPGPIGGPTGPVPGPPFPPGPEFGGGHDPYGGPAQYDQPVSSQPVPPQQPMQGNRSARLITADGRQFALAFGATVIGRGETSQVRLADVGISRQHARLDFDGSRVVLTDLGSTNGTTVNGNRVNAVALQHGDVIQLGTTTVTFRLDG